MQEKSRSGKGNPNPSPATRFAPGKSGNPKGKTSEKQKADLKAGELAAQIQAKMLAHFAEQDAAAMAASLSGADLLKLIKDAMDREFGTAVQKAEVKGGFTVTISNDDANL